MSVEDRVRARLREHVEREDVALPPVDDVFARARRRTARIAGALVVGLLVVTAGVATAVGRLGGPAVDVADQPESRRGVAGGSVEVGLLDGTRLDLALPERVAANATDVELAASLYAAGSLEAALDGAAGWRIEVVRGELDVLLAQGEPLRVPSSSRATAARVDRAERRLGLQMGSWVVVASGASLTDADVDRLLEGIDLAEMPDGFVEYRGSLLLWVVDSPDLRLHGDDAAVSVFLRSCSTPSAETTPTGLTVSRVDDPNRGSHLTVLCDVDDRIEIWLDTATPLDDDELAGVDVQVLNVGSTLSAIQARSGQESVRETPSPSQAAATCEPARHSPQPIGADAENVLFEVGPLCPRGGHSTIWTGTEMIVWGGWGDEVGARRFADGAAFDPRTNTWREIADAPLTPRQYHIAAWTGSEMLIVGGVGTSSGAAYDPDTDTWREIPDAPIRITGEPIPRITGWVWTGEALVVWHVPTDRVAAYSPRTDTWRELPQVGLEADQGVLRWSGQHVYALGRQDVFPDEVPLLIARLDDESTAWEQLPEVSLSTGNTYRAAMPELTSWAGGTLIAWSEGATDGRTVALDPAVDRWEEIASTPVLACDAQPEPVVLDDRVLAFGWCGGTAIYDPLEDSWTPVDIDGVGQRRYAVWTGQEVLNWGDPCCYGTGGAPFTVRAWRYTPPPPN